MKALLVAVSLILFTTTAFADPRKTCPRFEAMRCRKNVVQLCSDADYKVVWEHFETCIKPEVCVEDEPGRAMCSSQGRIARKLTRAAVLVFGTAWVLSGDIKRMLE
jgi:hypothetical protein